VKDLQLKDVAWAELGAEGSNCPLRVEVCATASPPYSLTHAFSFQVFLISSLTCT
jgi:hypothetical protein